MQKHSSILNLSPRLRLSRTRVAPGQIDRIGLDRLQRRPGLLDRAFKGRQRIGAVQARVIADHRTRRHSRQPLGQRVQRLPLEQRQVVLLVGLEEMSYADVALALNIPIGTVMSRLSRGRERLRALMAGTQPGAKLQVVR